jgi:methylthioribose-1-phosphate isomerase
VTAPGAASAVDTLRVAGDALELIDQRLLPRELVYVRCRSAAEVADAIRAMVVRGAPAIGCAAAFGIALEAGRHRTASRGAFDAALNAAFELLAASRPTAVNLFWALERMRRKFLETAPDACPGAADALAAEAAAILSEDLATNRAIGAAGADLVPDGARVMTHCNAGALATAGHGTALGVMRSARDQGKRISVLANETRPFLQGARLTAWELMQEGIPVTLITDSMAGHMMQRGKVDLVIVGADRIAANGDAANKIGTYTVAVLASRHGLPFYVAAPLSTIDMNIADGSAIPIEERHADEVTGHGGSRWAPEGVTVANPAFDVTPAELITGLITEKGVLKAPYGPALKKLFRR